VRDSPLIVSLLIGLIAVLVVAGVSLLVKMNSLSDLYKKEIAKKIGFEKSIGDLQDENSGLKEKIDYFNLEMKDLKRENTRLEDLRKKLRENLEEGSRSQAIEAAQKEGLEVDSRKGIIDKNLGEE